MIHNPSLYTGVSLPIVQSVNTDIPGGKLWKWIPPGEYRDRR